MSEPTELSARQRLTAKKVAKDILGSPAPYWADLGDDVREAKFESFIERLNQTDNCRIATILAANKDLAFQLLREKAKSMRSEAKRKAKSW